MSSAEALREHYHWVYESLCYGELVPFFGAGVNLCERPDDTHWSRPEDAFLPSGGELAEYLASKHEYPDEGEEGSPDLLRVAQYVQVGGGGRRLMTDLRRIFAGEYEPTTVHCFFASIATRMRNKGMQCRFPVVVTTNYDDLMEKAFRQADPPQPFDILSYASSSGLFTHMDSNGKETLVESPEEYPYVNVEQRPIVLKLHGAVSREDPNKDSFVIAEDDYIDYMSGTPLIERIPRMVTAVLNLSDFLFLGYSLRDWNLRVFLHRLWKRRQQMQMESADLKSGGCNTWAVLRLDKSSAVEERFWRYRHVEIIDAELHDYIEGLQDYVSAQLDKLD